MERALGESERLREGLLEWYMSENIGRLHE